MKVIYEMEVGEALIEKSNEDTPEKYAVVEAATASGIMVYGLFHGEWFANPSCRVLIAHLLRKSGVID